MFDLDTWREIFAIMQKNKLRTMLTAFSVAWGIFILIILLGVGKGLQNGAENQFKGDAANSIWIFPGRTTMPYKGMAVNRQIQLKNNDYEAVSQRIHGVEHLTARYSPPTETSICRYKEKYAAYDIKAVTPDCRYLENLTMVSGRYINEQDLTQKRKSAVVSTQVEEFFYGTNNAIGQYIQVGNIQYQVVGTFTDEGGERDMKRIYIPLSTAQQAYNAMQNVHQIAMTVADFRTEDSKAMQVEIRQLMAEKHLFSPSDKRAVYVSDNITRYLDVVNLLRGIQIFLWVVGIGTLVAGIVGVSNIMLISVHERTKEIGIRKAIGATPFSVVFLILQEAIFITIIAGYLGLVSGVGVLQLMQKYLPQSDFFQNPEIDFQIVITAIVLLVIAGAIAGFFPAWRAAKIRPIVALRA